MKRLFLIAVISFSIIPLSSYAADDPIYIEADQMASTEKNSTVVFTGNVDAKQGGLRIRSDEMTVYYSGESKAIGVNASEAKQQIEKLVCVGNVELTSKEWLGTAEKMVYFATKEQVVLNGNAKAWKGQNMVSGEKIIYYIKEGRSEVVGGTSATVGGAEKKKKEKKRVKMTILQQ
ncbi:MAG: lipopolysaccharide transport periplasmic protein LptA [Desulfobacterales bacterium]|nr:MAG: lipopolysaccharide transport periplasmic protein LptA [Desulfobacterales bacterium]